MTSRTLVNHNQTRWRVPCHSRPSGRGHPYRNTHTKLSNHICWTQHSTIYIYKHRILIHPRIWFSAHKQNHSRRKPTNVRVYSIKNTHNKKIIMQPQKKASPRVFKDQIYTDVPSHRYHICTSLMRLDWAGAMCILQEVRRSSSRGPCLNSVAHIRALCFWEHWI